MALRTSHEELSQREPEKTPLIDIIFLLLIFFFVSLTTLSSVQQRKGPEENTRQKLLYFEHAVPEAPDTSQCYLRLVDLSGKRGFEKSLIDALKSLAKILGEPDPVSFEDTTDVMISFVDVEAWLVDVEARLKEAGAAGGAPTANDLWRRRPRRLGDPNLIPDWQGLLPNLYPGLDPRNPNRSLQIYMDKEVQMRHLRKINELAHALGIFNIDFRVLVRTNQ